MESFFFNITDTFFKVSQLIPKKETEYITRVDISSGIVFLDISLSPKEDKIHTIKNLDRMIAISVLKEGVIKLHDNLTTKNYKLKENSIDIFASSHQDYEIRLNKGVKVKLFVLFVADFILKRYLSAKQSEVINFLYHTLQKDISIQHIDSQALDAMSLYIIEKITRTKADDLMSSLISEHNILELMIHRFKLLDIETDTLTDDELCITRSAKAILLNSFTNPPTIDILAHMCATNETKLKAVFKKKYKTTIYSYIQKLRLEKANYLLREQLLNIGEIAKEVGYKHQGHFTKLFFEYYGVYPKELLKR